MAKRDLTGQRFGRLTAIRPVRSEKGLGVIWLCKCDCGGEKEVPAARLTRGTTKSCGCLAQEQKHRTDITGQRFGRLVAEEFLYYNDKYQDCWRFRCDCGNEKIMPAANVKWGRVRSCGCIFQERIENLNKQDIAGERFDRLVAVCPTDKRDASGSIIWECRCDCGNTAFYSVNALRNGRVHSCGCVYRETRVKCASYRKDFVESTSLSALVNAKEPRSDNSTGCTGVYLDKRSGSYTAYINFQKKRYILGSYKDLDRAVRIRKAAEARLHDPFIMEQWDRLTEESRKKFLTYKEENGESGPEGTG